MPGIAQSASTPHAFAYRPYTTTSEVATHLNGRVDGWEEDTTNEESDDGKDKKPKARIVSRQQQQQQQQRIPTTIRTTQSLDSDRAQMARLQKSSMTLRISEAKRILDDAKFELHPMDPPPWCDSSMKLILANVHSFQLPDPSWQWVSPRWLIDMTLDVDDDGWQYSSRFGQTVWHGRHSATRSFVRRRRWLRLRRRPRATSVQGAEAAGAPDDSNMVVELQPLANDAKVRRKKTMLLANKFKNKVSSGYVGACPKSPTKPEAKPLAYTLKDGRYRSHHLKAVDSYAIEVAARVLSCPSSPVDYSQPSSPKKPLLRAPSSATNPLLRAQSSALLSRFPKLSDGNIPGTRIPYSHMSNIGAIAEDEEEDKDENKESDDDSSLSDSSDVLAIQPSVPAFNIIGSSPGPQSSHAVDSEQQQPNDTLQSLKRCLSESWMKRDLRRTPASSLRLSLQRSNDESDASDASDDDSKSVSGAGGGGSRHLPLPTIIDKHTGSAVSLCVPKLTPLAPPEPTSPRSPSDPRGPAADDSMELVRRHEGIIARKLSQQAKRRAGGRSLLRIASFLGSSSGGGGGGSRRPSIVHSIRSARSIHSMHSLLAADTGAIGDEHREEDDEDEPALPQPRQSKVHLPKHDSESESEDEDDVGLSIASKVSTSTAYDSTSDLSMTTDSGALEFYSGDNRALLDSYVDPYANHNRVPDLSAAKGHHQKGSTVLDSSLIKMASDSLKSMIGELLLDRERLEFLREGLASGGITAATVWYSFPWLHLELLQFDASRQRLISMLLAHSHTCPPDALRIFASALGSASTAHGADDYEQAFVESLDARDREEYLQLQKQTGLGGCCASLSLSQVWRFVIRPVVAHDSDLFYSDYKMMAMGIARLSMAPPPPQSSKQQHAR
ncbi:hypothetical protein EV175_000317 [Coemansia sp. RSA 1933]|nr:hypothetical protein EV175_000317 [Coemansia sp. RSA 1933]